MVTQSLGELALGVLRTQVDALRAHEPGTRAGVDPEELHDMRVATRRLRAALRVFVEVLPPEAEALRQEAGWLGRSLATVRDLDVQLAQLQEWRVGLPEPDRAGLDALSNLVSEHRVQARAELLAVLDSERYSQFVASAEHVLQIGSENPSPLLAEAEAPRLIGRPYRKLRKSGDPLDAHSPSAELHALRIRAKRLRYAVEFVTPVYGGPARRFVSRVVGLQDLLGDHQDAHVASDRFSAGSSSGSGSKRCAPMSSHTCSNWKTMSTSRRAGSVNSTASRTVTPGISPTVSTCPSRPANTSRYISCRNSWFRGPQTKCWSPGP